MQSQDGELWPAGAELTMAWIESHQSLKDHPKLLDLCGILEWDQDVAIGKLHRLWWWCLDYAVDGDLQRFNDSQIALGMGVAIPQAKRVVEALVQARWLERQPYFRVRNWWQYVGRFLQIKWKNNENQWKRVRVLYLEPETEPRIEPPLEPPEEPPQAVQPNLTNLTNQPNSKFEKPRFDEMEDHAIKIGLPPTEIDGFFNHYEANGWKVGKVPMKSWRAAMVNWRKNHQAGIFSGSAKKKPHIQNI